MKAKQPNIMLVMTDEQRFDQLGVVNPVVQTPHLDALAGDGCLFTRGYTTNPSCVPARASLATGKYPSQCGTPTYVTYLPDDETTFMSLLREGGYHTAVVGKQHFGPSEVERGYDDEQIIDSHFVPEVLPEPPSGNSWFEFLRSRGVRGLKDVAEPMFPFVQRWTADAEFHVDSYVGDCALQWLQDRRPKDKPWYFCVSFLGPHMPFDGLGLPHDQNYEDTDFDLPPTSAEDLSDKPAHHLIAHGTTEPGTLSVEEIRLAQRSSHANMTLIDEQVGKLFHSLKQQGLYDNTLIIFVSDHGDYLGDFGKLGKSQCLAEVLMRIPFIIKPPLASPRSKRIDTLVNLVDVAPTCLAAAGLPIPDSWLGQDLSACWKTDSPPLDRDRIYMEVGRIRGLRWGRWKISHYFERNYGELYDLEQDPWEKRNLWSDPDHQEIRATLRAALLDEVMKMSPRHASPWNDQSNPPSPEI